MAPPVPELVVLDVRHVVARPRTPSDAATDVREILGSYMYTATSTYCDITLCSRYLALEL